MPVIKKQRAITDADIPQLIARDTETAAAITVHETASNPHPIYQKLLPATVVQQSVSAPAQISIVANSWFDLGVWNNVNSGNSESLFAMSLYIQYIVAGETYSHWQYAGAALISPVWWKAGGGGLVKYVDMECHNGIDFTLSFRLGLTQANRMVQLLFPTSLSARLIRATFVRFL